MLPLPCTQPLVAHACNKIIMSVLHSQLSYLKLYNIVSGSRLYLYPVATYNYFIIIVEGSYTYIQL